MKKYLCLIITMLILSLLSACSPAEDIYDETQNKQENVNKEDDLDKEDSNKEDSDKEDTSKDESSKGGSSKDEEKDGPTNTPTPTPTNTPTPTSTPTPTPIPASCKMQDANTLVCFGGGEVTDSVVEGFLEQEGIAKDEIKKIIVEDGITVIDDLSGFINATHIELADTVTEINYRAFEDCVSLETINLPPDLKSLGRLAFLNCESIKTEVPEYAYTIIDDNSITFDGFLFKSKQEDLNFFTVPNTLCGRKVVGIGDSAFNCEDDILVITVPDGVTSIGSMAFSICRNLRKVNLPDSITKISSFAFSDCFRLSDLSLPKNLEFLGAYAFCNCDALKVDVPRYAYKILSEDTIACMGYAKDAENEFDYIVPEMLYGRKVVAMCAEDETLLYNAYNDIRLVCIPDTVTSIDENVFMFWQDNSEERKAEWTIVCDEGSYAETWTKEHGYHIEYHSSNIANGYVWDTEDELPKGDVPVYNTMIEPYYDETKGEVALKDTITGSVIKFTYDPEKYGIYTLYTDRVYMYDKKDITSYFIVKTVIDEQAPEIHSYQAYYNKHFSRWDKEDITEYSYYVSGCQMKMVDYFHFVNMGVMGRWTSRKQGFYGILSDGSTIMLEPLSIEKDFLAEELFLSFELYSTGDVAPQSGLFAEDGLQQWEYRTAVDEEGNALFEYSVNYFTDSIIIDKVYQNYEIPEEIDGIPVRECGINYLKTDLENVTNVVFPESVVNLDSTNMWYTSNGWFDGNYVVPNIKYISSSAKISSSGTVALPDSIEYIYGTVITKETNKITLPKNLKYISEQKAADSNTTTECVQFQNGDNPVWIADNAFSALKNLNEVVFSENIVYIGSSAFSKCSQLKEVTLPSDLRYIGGNAFDETGLSGTYVIPDGTIYIGYRAFPKTVDTLVIPDSVQAMGAFYEGTTIITTEGSKAATLGEKNGWNLVIISEEEMAEYQAKVE